MKLVDKFTLWFIGIIVLTTPVTAYMCYYNLEKRIDEVEIARLKEVNGLTASRLRQGIAQLQQAPGALTEVVPVAGALPQEKVQVQKLAPEDDAPHHQESRLIVHSYYNINNTGYRVSSSNFIPGSKQILNAILNTVVWKLLLIVVCVCITARLVSQRILGSLQQTMKVIQGFNVKQKTRFPKTGTEEFRQLNGFLQRMTDRVADEYAAVKEFSENASHELQTPLAVLRSKLELLSETNIEECQASLISDMQHAVEKLTRINRSLTVLAKLENKEYQVSENIRFCRVARDVLAVYEDRIEMKNISVKTDIDKHILLKIHPTLADMLMNNLLGNAIRHNVQNGTIEIVLTHKRLVVKNTGLPPEVPVEELFRRFKKGNQCSESIGLGLAIVKQICEVCGYTVSYHFRDGLHILQVDFEPVPQEEAIEVPQGQLEPSLI